MVNNNERRPMQIIGFKIEAPEIAWDTTYAGSFQSRVTYTAAECVAKIKFTLDDYSDMVLESEIYIPPELRNQILALLQDHLDNRAKRK